ncbi:hypothetical protein NCAS_0C04190 [Naumovozyma castellii]|uniref:ATP synthase subunit g, mitochondrial n=1 Tax=Naumovozyma castellii TaxID=27288 RepID=G0VD47_NAUCA|nr:hypothetical protein NCAS_0C04190 [Naumovozyma castellii CBS 4309]CCC69409.1 hypothetical protein NCAS_0C04190 [Naumovozyma castellii CBS 4309]
MLGKIQATGSKLFARGGVITGRIMNTSNVWLTKSIYYGKVGAELSKEIYRKEGLTPPNVDEFKSVYAKLLGLGKEYSKKPTELLNMAKSLKKNDLLKYGSYGVQILGFFSLGEVIGRRKLVGYKHY